MDILKTKDYNNVYELDCFAKEFKSIFKNDGNSLRRYSKWLRRELKFLDCEGKNAIQRVNFEHIADQIYSIRSPRSKCNPRVLYTFIISNNTPLLLTAFLEKDSSDYNEAIKKSKTRIKKLSEEE